MRGESQVIKLINIFLDGLVSVGNDAGFTGDSVLAKMMEFGGQPPRGSGMDQSNLSMINALNLYRDKHYEFPIIERIVWRLLKKPVTAMYITALLVDQYYHGINPNSKNEKGEEDFRAYNESDKVALWVKHMAEQGVRQPMGLVYDDALRVYRYGLKSGKRLVRRDLGYERKQ